MEKENDFLEGQTDSDEDLFDLSLDDLEPDDLEQETVKEDPDEDIIELMELVEKGENDLDYDNGEVADIAEEDQPTEELLEDDMEEISDEESSLDPSDLDLSDMSLGPDLDLLDEEEVTGDDTAQESEDISFDNMLEEDTDQDMDLIIDTPIEPEESLDDLAEEIDEDETVTNHVEEPEVEAEEGVIDKVGFDTILDDEKEDDMDVTIQSPIDAHEPSEPEEETPPEELDIEKMEEDFPPEDSGDEVIQDQGITPEEFEEEDIDLRGEGEIGISEEKIEEIVTRVVGDVVERVVRETMADVAEKVIREAIDALKQSLEDD